MPMNIRLPSALSAVVPPSVRTFAGQYPFSKWFGITIAVLVLYGPVIGQHVDHNGWRYLFGPLISTAAAGIYFVLWPPNHYRGYSARLAGMAGLDARDPNAARLVSLLRSKSARIVVWRASINVLVIETSAMAFLLAFSIETDQVTWALSSSWFWPGLLLCFLGSFMAVGSELLAWALRTWMSPMSQ